MKPLVDAQFINNLPGLPKDFLNTLRSAAKNAGVKRIAIVGGIVRDEIIKLIHANSFTKFYDIDLVLEGNSCKGFINELQKILGKDRLKLVKINTDYNTYELSLNGLKIDLAQARLETYNYLAENPKVTDSTLEEDLYRRDFTANAIALELINNELIDMFNGIDSIKKKELSFLHKGSVADDPTRIVRAARYSSRFGFEFASESLIQIKSTLNSWPWEWSEKDPSALIPPALGTRLRMELDLLFKNEYWPKSIQKLQECNGLLILDKEIQNNKRLLRAITWGVRLGVNPLTALVAYSKEPYSLAKRLQLSKSQQSIIFQSIELKNHLSSLLEEVDYSNWKASEFCDEVEKTIDCKEAVGILISMKVPSWRFLLKWWGKWRYIKSSKSASQLLKDGWKEGPGLGKELRRLRAIEIDS